MDRSLSHSRLDRGLCSHREVVGLRSHGWESRERVDSRLDHESPQSRREEVECC